jgi:hypothetical protein
MTPARFGELLDLGSGRLQAAVTHPGPCPAGQREAARQLLWLTRIMTGYLHDIAPWDQSDAIRLATVTWWQSAALDMRAALTAAAAYLAAAAGPGEAGPGEARPDSLLAGAATALATGRDLLNTHRLPAADATWDLRSLWAQVITSPPATRALAGQVADWSLLLALLAERAAAARPAHPDGPAIALRGAARYLRTAAATADPARHADPPQPGDLAVLCSIPAARPPDRIPPQPGEPDSDLCLGITVSAARLQAAAETAARHAPRSPAATAGAWRWTATAGAVTSHISQIILASAAARAVQLALPGAAQVAAAADAMAAAIPRWHVLAIRLGQVSTETRFLASPAVTEASDLIVRLGRLARTDPAWTPAARNTAPVRSPARTAPDPAAAAAIITAVHHAACAAEATAIADQAAIRAAYRAGRLYVPTRSLPERRATTRSRDVPRPYAPAPPDRAERLDGAYQCGRSANSLRCRSRNSAPGPRC